MARINLFMVCNESTLILHQQLILIYFGKLKNNVSKIGNVIWIREKNPYKN
ncbi:hypothetical protein VCRA219O19_140031 [Vibrio crassostreae]|nr:hypothetical protein VCRA219O19_140031 [Vibrio crassostreae]